MSTQKWISFLLMSLSIALVALAWLSRPTFCLDSRLVEKIDSVRADGQASLLACKVSRSGSKYSEDMIELRKLIEPRLQKLEREFQFLGFDYQSLKISIVESLDPLVRVHPSHLLLSRSALEQSQVLEKAILLAVLSQRGQTMPLLMTAEQVTWAEVFSDVFLSVAYGQLHLSDPITNERVVWKESKQNWPLVLKTKQGYCSDSWRSYLHSTKCETDGLSESDLFVGLRPLIGKALRESLRQLPLNQQIEFLRLTFENWKSLKPNFESLAVDANTEDLKQLQLLESQLHALQSSFDHWGLQFPIWKTISESFAVQLKRRGFDNEQKILQADLIVMGHEHDQSHWLQSLSDLALQNPLKRIIYLTEQDARVLPDLKSVPRSWLGSIQSRQAVLIQCQIPTTQKLAEMSDTVAKLVLVRDCKTPFQIDFAPILEGNLDQFASQNPKMSFVQLHLPSLKSALAKRNLNPIFLIEEKKWDSPFFQDIGWEKPKWDETIGAYRTRAAIEAIEMYRALVPEEPALPL